MSDEFQWRSGMRKLDVAVQPARDLWPDLAARIERETAQAARTRRQAWRQRLGAMAATVVIASGAGLVAFRQDGNGTSGPTLPPAMQARTEVAAPTALDWAVPADPKLAAAAHDLDKASAELQAALDARPDAVFLVSMINRTNAQRMRLVRQSAISG